MRDQIHDDLRDVVGGSFQLAPEPSPPRLNPVWTEPGATTLTRMPSCRSSCISASLNALRPAFDAQYAAPPTNGLLAARLLTLMIQPPPRALRCGMAAWQQW